MMREKMRRGTFRFNSKYSETNVLSLIEEEEEGLLGGNSISKTGRSQRDLYGDDNNEKPA